MSTDRHMLSTFARNNLRRAAGALFATLAVALAACSEPPEMVRDTGRADAVVSDMGNTPMDTATPMDTGVEPPDGEVMDTGVLDMDAVDLDGSSPPDVASPDVPPRDTRTTCVAGEITCATADRTRTCLDDGGYSESECPAGRVCVEGRGCAVCEPGSRRCTADGARVEQCGMDGMTWSAMTTCNAAGGEVCEGFRCVNLCQRAAGQRSYLGCEYWPTTLPNPLLTNQSAFTFAVTIANPNAFAVTATFSGGGLATPRVVSVPANTTQTEVLPWVSSLSTLSASALVRNGSYRLVTNAPVAVYQFNPLQFQSGGANSFTNDASLLLPTHVLTGNYMIMSHGAWMSYGSFGAIVGTRDGTTVSVALRAPIAAGTGVAAAGAGTTATYMLNRGDVLVLTNTTGNAACTGGDMTGSVVTASAPVAAYGGHVCTQMPCGSAACDHLEEALFPVETWGTSYVVSGLRERSPSEPSVIRILSRTAGNVLTFTGIARPPQCPAMLNAGEYCEFQTVPDFQVSGSGPLFIAQFMMGQGAVPGVGDPAMVLEVPTQQFRTNYVFNVPASYTTNFVTVVFPTGTEPRSPRERPSLALRTRSRASRRRPDRIA